MDKVLLQTWKLQKCTEFSKSPKEMQWHEKLDIDSNTFENFNHFCDTAYKGVQKISGISSQNLS